MRVSKSQFKPRMLEYMRRVQTSGEPLIITEYNRPVLKLEALTPDAVTNPATLFADVRGRARIHDDALLAPTTEEWTQLNEEQK